MTYLAIIEPNRAGFTAYSPDFPVCSVRGLTEADAEEALRDAIKNHVRQMKTQGEEIPKNLCKAAMLRIPE